MPNDITKTDEDYGDEYEWWDAWEEELDKELEED